MKTLKNNAKVSILAVCVVCLSMVVYAGQEEWLTDIKAAKELARDKNLPILADFAGTDWCGWCIKLDQEVFSQDAFKAYAKTNLVLFLADYPHFKQLPAETVKQNKTLSQQYRVEGFPTVLLLDANGSELARTGYRPGGSKEYVDYLVKLIVGLKKDASTSAPTNAPPEKVHVL